MLQTIPWFEVRTPMHKLMILSLSITLALMGSAAAKKRHHSPPSRYAPIAVPAPEDPEAYAMRFARQTWPGRALCDFGGYRIVPCDIVPNRPRR